MNETEETVLGESVQLTSNESIHVNEVHKPSIVGAGISGCWHYKLRHIRSGFITKLVDIDAGILGQSVPLSWKRLHGTVITRRQIRRKS